MVRATLVVTVPEDVWIGRVSRANPDAIYRLLSGMPTGDGSMELGEVTGERATAAARAVDDDPAVESFDLLGTHEDRAIAVYHTSSRELYALAMAVSVPLEYPITIVDGEMSLEFNTTREGLRRITSELDERGASYELRSLTESGDEPIEHLLTDRQQDVLAAAWGLGYYAVPRECSLADVAAEVGIDESTASTTLRRAERSLVGTHFEDDRGR